MGVLGIELKTRASGGQSSLSLGQAQSLPPYGIAPACAVGPEVRLGALESAPELHHLADTLREAKRGLPGMVRSAAVIIPVPSKFSVELCDLVRQARWLVREARPRQAGAPARAPRGGRRAAWQRVRRARRGPPPVSRSRECAHLPHCKENRYRLPLHRRLSFALTSRLRPSGSPRCRLWTIGCRRGLRPGFRQVDSGSRRRLGLSETTRRPLAARRCRRSRG